MENQNDHLGDHLVNPSVITVNLSLTESKLSSLQYQASHFRYHLNSLEIEREQVLLKENIPITLPIGTVVMDVQLITPYFQKRNIQINETKYQNILYHIYDKDPYLPSFPTIKSVTAIIPRGTTIVDRSGQERILAFDTEVTLPDYCPIQVLPGALLQSYKNTKKCTEIFEPCDMYIHYPQW
jgi:hypothetical protein